MASITVTFLDKSYTVAYPDALEGVIIDSLASEYGYQVNIQNPAYNFNLPVTAENSPVIVNTTDKALFVVEKFVEQIVQKVKQKQINTAIQAAQQAAQAQAEQALSGVNVTPVV